MVFEDWIWIDYTFKKIFAIGFNKVGLLLLTKTKNMNIFVI